MAPEVLCTAVTPTLGLPAGAAEEECPEKTARASERGRLKTLYFNSHAAIIKLRLKYTG